MDLLDKMAAFSMGFPYESVGLLDSWVEPCLWVDDRTVSDLLMWLPFFPGNFSAIVRILCDAQAPVSF